MTAGIWKITNYYNRVQAWREWQALAQTAVCQGMGDLVEEHKPSEGAGWKEIDRKISQLRDAMQKRDYENVGY